MKTKNNAENKQSKVKAAFLKGGIIVISLVMISYTAIAQNEWKQFLAENSYVNTVALLAGNAERNVPTTFASVHANRSEDKTSIRSIKHENDYPLALEPWMLKTEHFSKRAIFVAPEIEEILELEEWMIINKYFRAGSPILVEKDQKLKLEMWMIESKFWQM